MGSFVDPAPEEKERVLRILPDDGERRPAVNLAGDEALARCASRSPRLPILRLWRSDRCVVLGRAQIAAAEADMIACRELRIPVLRRFTGGGAVYHDPGNLNVTLVAARDEELARRQGGGLLPGLYRLVLEPLTTAVRALGGDAVSDERAVWLGGRKVSGVAAWLGAETVLVHATLLVDADLEVLERALAGPGAPGDPRWERTKSRRVAVTSLAAEGVATSRLAIDEAVVAAFSGVRDVADASPHPRDGGIQAEAFTSWEEAEAARLLAVRYGRASWHELGREESAG